MYRSSSIDCDTCGLWIRLDQSYIETGAVTCPRCLTQMKLRLVSVEKDDCFLVKEIKNGIAKLAANNAIT